MEIKEHFKGLLKMLPWDRFSTDIVKSLSENCCDRLTGKIENYDFRDTENLKGYEIELLYAALSYVFAEFARHERSSQDFIQFLTQECEIDEGKSKVATECYERYFSQIRLALLNIGNHLPHVTDVKWKIDYIIKSNTYEHSSGPVFRIGLKTEQYNEETEHSGRKVLHFTCTSQELQDLVYKLKDVVRHCQKLSTEH
ncbi:COMM domain-containing protein 3 [Cylas formicarius]|uniref:COMM domain-containing protein 3 n=1 Tax=Cylas formicarius TaxID=197179 RepID=UPI0029583FDE|nr:COMM domain-containing protein 3 [Cylas formicarius]